jgi:hypothetical protein
MGRILSFAFHRGWRLGGNVTGLSMLLTDLAAKELEIRGSFHDPICPKPAITLSRRDWHLAANGAVV